MNIATVMATIFGLIGAVLISKRNPNIKKGNGFFLVNDIILLWFAISITAWDLVVLYSVFTIIAAIGTFRKPQMMFPQATAQWMLINSISFGNMSSKLTKKLETMLHFTDMNNKNRWFGYCQMMGETFGIWTLDEIIEMVRAERDGF